MICCNKIKYKILSSEKIQFVDALDDLLNQLPTSESVFRLVLFGRTDNTEEYLKRYEILQSKIKDTFGSKMPAFTYVSQPVLSAALLLEVHSYTLEDGESVFYKSENGFPYVLLENKVGRFLFAGAFRGTITDSIEKQSIDVFFQIEELLQIEKFPINSIVRQWNYIEQITAFDGEDQHYQSFNNVRSDFYHKADWTKGYPAATGIGTNSGGVLIDFDAVVLTSEKDFITPIDNSLQVAAHAYSEKVLENSFSQKKTPKFERAKSITINNRRFIYVSGTAAIRGEESLKGIDLDEQLCITMENIEELIKVAKPLLLRVYLKNETDYEKAESLLHAIHPDIPISYMQADVCRDELLIEIEGIAIE